MKIDKANNRVYVRQSWLGDVMMCPERARLALKNPQIRMPSDATIIGTALHHGIETFINTAPDVAFAGAEVEEIIKVSVAEYQRLALEPHKKLGLMKPKFWRT